MKEFKRVLASLLAAAVLVVAMPMIAAPTTVSAAEDILFGIGSFEDATLTGWQEGGAGEATIDTSVYHSGTASLKLDRTALSEDDTDSVHITQSKENDCGYYLPVSPNTHYTVTFWYKVSVGAQLYFDFHGFADVESAIADEASGYTYGVCTKNVSTSQDWTEVSFSFLTSDNVNLLRIAVANNGYSGIVWVDDMTMSVHEHVDVDGDNECDMELAVFGGDRSTVCGGIVDESVVSNEIVIGSFEGTHGWLMEGTGSSVSSAATYRGIGALRLARETGSCYARKLVGLEANTVYVLSYRYSTSVATTLPLYAHGYDSAASTNLGGKSLKVTYDNTNGAWKQATVLFKTDSDAMTNVQFQFINNTDGATAYVDDVVLTKHVHNDANNNGFCDATEIHMIAANTVDACPEEYNRELINDGSFEQASLVSNWGGKGSVSTAYARTGSQSLMLPAPVGGSTQLATYTAYNIVGGETYRFSFWVYNPNTSGDVRLSYAQFTSNWKEPETTYDLFPTGNTGGAWKLISIDVHAKENTGIFQFTVNTSENSNGAAYVDDMSLVHIGDMSMPTETVEGNLHKNPGLDYSRTLNFTTLGNSYISGGVAHIEITKGLNSYLQSAEIAVEADSIYTLSFWVKVVNADALRFNLYMTAAGTKALPGWKDYALSSSVTANTDGWVKQTVSFSTHTAGRIAIGYRNYDTTGTTGSIYIDNISLVRSHVPADHNGDYSLQSSLKGKNMLSAGAFDTAAGWNFVNNTGNEAEEVVNKVAVIRPGYKEGVANPDYISSYGVNSALTPGKWYQVSFWMYIVPGSNLKVDVFVSGGSEGWNQKSISCATGKWVRVCRYFEAKAASSNVYIGFRDTSTGAAVSGSFYIDDVSIIETDAIKFTGTQATLNEQIYLDYHFQVPTVLVENGYLTGANINLTIDGKTQTVPFASATAVSNDGVMSVYSAPVAVVAAQMANTITTELDLADSVDRSVVLYDNRYTGYAAPDYSVKQNADGVIAGSATDAEKAAAKAMLNYGTHAQYYFLSDDGGDFAEAPLFANAALADADRFDKSETEVFRAQINNLDGYAISKTGSSDDFVGYSLVHKTTTSVRFFVKSADTVITIDGVAQTLKAHKNGYYYAEIADVKAVNLDAAHTVVIDGSLTINNISICSVARTVINNSAKSVNFRNLMIGLVLYAQAVDKL